MELTLRVVVLVALLVAQLAAGSNGGEIIPQSSSARFLFVYSVLAGLLGVAYWPISFFVQFLWAASAKLPKAGRVPGKDVAVTDSFWTEPMGWGFLFCGILGLELFIWMGSDGLRVLLLSLLPHWAWAVLLTVFAPAFAVSRAFEERREQCLIYAIWSLAVCLVIGFVGH